MSTLASVWDVFESALTELMCDLVKPTLHDTVRFVHPDAASHQQIVLASATGAGPAALILSLGGNETDLIAVNLHDESPQTFRPSAERLARHLREEWHIPHPELVVVTADRLAGLRLERLGIGSPSQIVHEAAGQARALRRVARRGLGALPDEQPSAQSHTPEMLRAAVEEVIVGRYGSAEADEDGDYRVDRFGAGFYVSILEDRQVLRLWKTVVRGVASRRAATIEANYLNRSHPLTRWTLWGHDLVQEVYLPAHPFIPSHLDEMLERFAEQYTDTVSALRLRLNAEA